MDRDDRRSGERDEVVHAPAGGPDARSAGGTVAGMGGLAYTGLGFEFAAVLVASFYLGQWLDRRLGTAPVFLLVCMLVGPGGGFYMLYRQLMAAQRRADAARAAAKAARTGEASNARESQP